MKNTKLIQNKIITLRGEKVLLDRDLAEFYGVETKYLKRQVKRNNERFPEDFMIQLTPDEHKILKRHFGTSSLHGGSRLPPISIYGARYSHAF